MSDWRKAKEAYETAKADGSVKGQKLGLLKTKALESAYAALEAAPDFSDSVAGAPPIVAPTGIDFSASESDGLISERELCNRIVVQQATNPKRSTVRMQYNDLRTGVKTLRALRKGLGEEQDPFPVNLPTYSELGLRDDGTPEEKKPEPIPLDSTPFESEAEKAKREAQEAALRGEESEGDKAADKAKRLAEALTKLEDEGGPQWATSQEGQAELARAGIRPPSSKVAAKV